MSLDRQLQSSSKIRSVLLGYGSIGRRHFDILSKDSSVSQLKVLTSQNLEHLSTINSLNDVVGFDPDYFIIASPTAKHLKYLKEIDKLFTEKTILIEKPLFDRWEDYKVKKNKVYVGYNLRFHPVIDKLKDIVDVDEVIKVEISCHSFLPEWRKNIDYRKSSSAKKNMGGGVLLDLSHELDYLLYLFGGIDILHSLNSKVSNLDIETDDYLNLVGRIVKNNAIFSLDLTYFSYMERREITIFSSKGTIHADLIKNKLSIYSDKGLDEISFDNYEIAKSYEDQHKAILAKDNSKLCSYEEAKEVMKVIQVIKGEED